MKHLQITASLVGITTLNKKKYLQRRFKIVTQFLCLLEYPLYKHNPLA